MKIIDFETENCRSCYKCIRACEIKAIAMKNHKARIIPNQCVLCGTCMQVCPQNAKTFHSDIELVKRYLTDGAPVVVSLDPSYLGILHRMTGGQLCTALRRMGVMAIRETAEGAAYVTREYARLRREKKMDNILTSACPSFTDLVEKYYPSLVPLLAPVLSPMIVHARLIRSLYPENVRIVYIGPCIARKREALEDERTKGNVDAVIHFNELLRWLNEERIDAASLPETPFDNPDPGVNRHYAVPGGIIKAVHACQPRDDYEDLFIHGFEQCKDVLRGIANGEIHHSFLEMNLCEGGCIRGSALENMKRTEYGIRLLYLRKCSPFFPDRQSLEPFSSSAEAAFMPRPITQPYPTEEEITAILRNTGKYSSADELNCGACGYRTCREKAISVFQHKSEPDMCIPYMYGRTESVANLVLDSTPNLILLVDSELRIREFNRCAEALFHISRAEALHSYLFELIPAEDFEAVLHSKSSIFEKKVTYEKYGIVTMQNIVYMETHNMVLGLFQNITQAEAEKSKERTVKLETVEMAQRVIDKQMEIAQQIAGLLGETTAQTKVTLRKMRDIVMEEDE